MGYTTEFEGSLRVMPALTPAHAAYLLKFAETRRMKRRAEVTAIRPDPTRDAAGLPVGYDGAYFVGATAQFGQENTPDIVDGGVPPHNQPSLWCQWIPNSTGTAILWNGAEKFYEYERWLEYLIRNFLQPWGYTLDGEIEFQGEDLEDFGRIRVASNAVRVVRGQGEPNPRLRAVFEPIEEDEE